jgi:Xaa-Pro aminopeptidase
MMEHTMHTENVSKLAEYLHFQGLQAALLASPFNLTWLTGYAPPIQTGASPFEGGPALGWFLNGELSLLVSDGEAGPAGASGANVFSYAGYTVDEPLACSRRMADAFGEMLKPYAGLKGKVGVEMAQLPAALFVKLQASLSQATFVDLDQQIDPLRLIKTAQEIEKIRAALRLADLAQFEIRKHLQPGVTELELWTLVKSKVELQAGCRVPVLADLVAGVRTADIGGLPSGYALRPGDPVMLDFVPRIDGYWGDNCNGYFVGQAPKELEKIYQVVRGALKAGAEAIRPGVRANELDVLVRNHIRQAGYEPYPHHTGHGLGATFHDEPRIVPYNTQLLVAGMVLVLEPGIYLPGIGGVRLEDAFLVTEGGSELLTTHLK